MNKILKLNGFLKTVEKEKCIMFNFTSCPKPEMICNIYAWSHMHITPTALGFSTFKRYPNSQDKYLKIMQSFSTCILQISLG